MFPLSRQLLPRKRLRSLKKPLFDDGIPADRVVSRRSTTDMGVWKLGHDLTMEVFRRLGDDSLTIRRLEFTCRTFREYAKDPTLYTHIRVIGRKDYIGDGALSTLINRATPLRSLHVVLPKNLPNPPVFDAPFPMDIPVFSDSFIKTFRGKSDSLESLVLHNLEVPYDRERAVCNVLSSCPKLKHVEIINCLWNMRTVVLKLTKKCALLETLVLVGSGEEDDRLTENLAKKISRKLPRLSTLRLQGCPISYEALHVLQMKCENLENYLCTGDEGVTVRGGAFLFKEYEYD